MIAKFGNWEIHKEGIDNSLTGYYISNKTLWATQNFSGQLLWEKLLHISRKTHITSEDFNDFIIAFIFAQDYFNSEKPDNLKQISTAQSIYVSTQIVKLREKKAAEKSTKSNIVTAKEVFDNIDEIFSEEREINLLPERA